MRNFEHTMNVLVKAYFNDTLKHGSYNACAVGNIVSSHGVPIGRTIKDNAGYNNTSWKLLFFTKSSMQQVRGYYNNIVLPQFIRAAQQTISKTGYSVDELARVEFAFESAEHGKTEDDWMFNGLMAVLEVLAEIHNVDLSGKEIFSKQLEEIHLTR